MSVLGFTLARISGVSMEPMLTDGSVALFRRPLEVVERVLRVLLGIRPLGLRGGVVAVRVGTVEH